MFYPHSVITQHTVTAGADCETYAKHTRTPRPMMIGSSCGKRAPTLSSASESKRRGCGIRHSVFVRRPSVKSRHDWETICSEVKLNSFTTTNAFLCGALVFFISFWNTTLARAPHSVRANRALALPRARRAVYIPRFRGTGEKKIQMILHK